MDSNPLAATVFSHPFCDQQKDLEANKTDKVHLYSKALN